MNIKINKDQADYLFSKEIGRVLIGSRLYGTFNGESDYDYLVFHNILNPSVEMKYSIRHQFQYDDGNTQYIFTTVPQFFRNLLTGDSTINADIVMFNPDFMEGTDGVRLSTIRTYNTIKAYLGFAKRDIKDLKKGKGRNKDFHAQRSLKCAALLIDNILPILKDITGIVVGKYSVEDLEQAERILRANCNTLFDGGKLTMYPAKPKYNPEGMEPMLKELLDLHINSLNIKEFRYE